MKNRKIENISASEFYRKRRPEYFSDSEVIYNYQLTREHLAFEINQISKNQKQDEFETLCRKLAEKFIAPNLIPQVGPTGGGDGKTDFETHPVSESISNRWFIPENGWFKDEKWAFAISAKQTWKSKAKGDIEKIIGTEREYTRIYFMTNQTPKSKDKKDAQDEFIKKYKIDIVILDGEWILEKILGNKLIDLVVDSLNLSDTYKQRKIVLGENDAYRIKKLEEIENNINNPNRYFEYDFQLVEDALEAAILSRMLEKPREEIEGKFDRALRFCKKINNNKQRIRIHYQRAWTYLNWYNDYVLFLDEYITFKRYISEKSSISEIELYVNLFNLLRGVAISGNYDLSEQQIDIQIERKQLFDILNEFENDKQKPVSSITARTYKAIQELMDLIAEEKSPEKQLQILSDCILNSRGFLNYPFDSIKKIIEELGSIFPNNNKYDELVDVLASVSEQRYSELASGETFLKRAGQKFFAKYYKESIVYFGKAVLKLAKEESEKGMYLALIGLSQAYSSLGLIWASNNSLISASSISFKLWYEKGTISNEMVSCIDQLAVNELLIGRVPSFLSWHEILQILSKQIEIKQNQDKIPSLEFLDACFAVRVLNTDSKDDENISFLPEILANQDLWLSEDACLYKEGYVDLILSNYKGININTENELDSHFKLVAEQPFRNQMIFETNFLKDDKLHLSTKILGCEFNLHFKEDKDLLFVAEGLLAFFESFLATSLIDVYPNTEEISIELIENREIQYLLFDIKNSYNEYLLQVNSLNYENGSRNDIWSLLLKFTAQILARHFFINNTKEYLTNLFEKEELNERLSLIFEHKKFTINVLGENPKLFFRDWIKNKNIRTFPQKRANPLVLKNDRTRFKQNGNVNNEPFNPNQVGHDKRKVFSIINDELWNAATWKGFGFFADVQGLGIFIAYENGEAGKKIFDNWITKFGKEDKNEQIKITIIKGVDKNNPFWYRVHISSNVDTDLLTEGNVFVSASRFHEMNAENPTNITNLINGYNYYKRFRLCPAKITSSGELEPYLDKAILKQNLFVKNAWEINRLDLDSAAIKKDDKPIIPNEIKNAPILEVIKMKNE